MASITIPAGIPRTAYTGNGVQTVFPIPWPFFATADVQVYVADALQSSGYSVAGTIVDGGYQSGYVTFSVAPSNLASVVVTRVLAIERVTDFPYPSAIVDLAAVNLEFDRITAIVQNLDRKIGQARLLPTSEGSNITLPVAADRANKFDGYDASGNPALLANVDLSATTVSGFAATLLDDANSAAALATLNTSRLLWGGTTGGTANARTLTPATAITAYADGMVVTFRSALTNSGATTIDISGLGARAIFDKFGAALAANSLPTGLRTIVYYNNNFYLQNESGAPSYDVCYFGGGQIALLESGVDAQLQLNGTDAYLLHNTGDDRLEAWVQAALAPWRVGKGVLSDDTARMDQGWHLLQSTSVAASPTSVAFVLSTYQSRGFKSFRIYFRNLAPAVAAILRGRFSTDGGSVWKTAGGDYGNSWWLWNAAGTLQGGSGAGYVQLSASVAVQAPGGHAAGISGVLEWDDSTGVLIAESRTRWMAAGPLLEGLTGQSNTTFAGPVNAVQLTWVADGAFANQGSVHLLGLAA